MDILNHPLHCAQLKMELAAVVDFGEQFVKSTYNLEGDGTLVVTCYEEIVKLRAVIQAAHHPNVVAIACSLAHGNIAIQQQWTSYAFTCVEPGLDYFLEKFGDDTKAPLNIFKAARYFSPHKVFEMQPSASDLDCLSTINSIP